MIELNPTIETQLDAVNALNNTTSMLKGLWSICIALCECPSVLEEDACGLIADIVYYCSDINEKASDVIYAELRKSKGLPVDLGVVTSHSPETGSRELKRAA